MNYGSDQGKIAEVCAEAGEYTYDASTEPSVFAGGFGQGLIDSFKTMAISLIFLKQRGNTRLTGVHLPLGVSTVSLEND